MMAGYLGISRPVMVAGDFIGQELGEPAGYGSAGRVS